MAAGIETSIWLALKSRVESLPLSYAKAWPGQTFTPPSNAGKLAPFLRIGRVVGTPIRQLIDYNNVSYRSGFLIITLVYPLGQDVSVYDQIGSVIAAHFKDGTSTRYGNICVTIPEYPQVQEGYEDSGYWNTPVRIQWKCYA